MKIFFLLCFALCLFLFSCTTSYYIVRHAEKVTAEPNMSTDVPLTDAGKQRAKKLKEILKNKKIGYIFSTNTIRTKTTAEPTANYFGLKTELYTKPDSVFINKLKSLKKNTLITGHSNTVDDIVNLLCNEIKVESDLKDNEYDNLFVVKKKGRKYFFERRKY
jgi:phosphohistidine phosphatase SixA